LLLESRLDETTEQREDDRPVKDSRNVCMRDLSLLVPVSCGYSPSPSVCATATPGSIAAISPPVATHYEGR
jgi:hypothetical protein